MTDIQKAIKNLQAQLDQANLNLNACKARVKYLTDSIAGLRRYQDKETCIHCGQPEGNHAQKDDACPTEDFYSDSQRFEVSNA